MLQGKILEDNFYSGLATNQYEMHIKKYKNKNKFLTVSCGPMPMLKELNRITSKFNIKMKILMEKRMGCGIGVCMSCVCSTKNKTEKSKKEYSRVCVEGPLFDSDDIDWSK